MTTVAATARRTNRLPAIILVVLLAAGGFTVYWEFFQTYHLATVARGVLYRDGSHSVRELQNALRLVKPRTVVSLNDAGEVGDPAKPQLKEEEHVLAERNIRLVRISVKLGGWPLSRNVQEFLKVVDDPANRPVLVHCAQGVRRTGMFVAAYQMSVEKLNKDQAKGAIESFGHSDKTIDDIRRFIDAYDPQTRELSADLNQFKPAGAAE